MMKKILYIILDGLGDGHYICKELGNKTPLEAASTPTMDLLAEKGETGVMFTVGKGIAPESDIAVISILGYDPLKYYTGRGPLESFAAGLEVNDGDLAFRVNFATRGRGREIKDRRVGRNLSNEEASLLCNAINEEVRLDSIPARFEFKNTIGHRGVLVIRSSNGKLSGDVTNTDPAYGKEGALGVAKKEGTYENLIEYCRPVKTNGNLKACKSALLTNEFVLKSCEVLERAKINEDRRKRGDLPANLILLRDAGDCLPKFPKINERFKRRFGSFVEMPVEKGIAMLTGLDIIPVPETISSIESSYVKCAELALKQICIYDSLYIHIKGPDIPGHDGDAITKKAVIESIDRYFLTLIMEKIDLSSTIIAVTADHSTPCVLKSHSDDPVPLLISGGGVKPDDTKAFSERVCKEGRLGELIGTELLPLLVRYSDQ